LRQQFSSSNLNLVSLLHINTERNSTQTAAPSPPMANTRIKKAENTRTTRSGSNRRAAAPEPNANKKKRNATKTTAKKDTQGPRGDEGDEDTQGGGAQGEGERAEGLKGKGGSRCVVTPFF
jgi:hypothetical protein